VDSSPYPIKSLVTIHDYRGHPVPDPTRNGRGCQLHVRAATAKASTGGCCIWPTLRLEDDTPTSPGLLIWIARRRIFHWRSIRPEGQHLLGAPRSRQSSLRAVCGGVWLQPTRRSGLACSSQEGSNRNASLPPSEWLTQEFRACVRGT